MAAPIADSVSILIFVFGILGLFILVGFQIPILTNTNSLTSDPAICKACPKTCTTKNDCPSVLYSSNFNASVECTAGGCIYEYVPKVPIAIPTGFLGDQYCQQKLLRAPPCFSIMSLADCTGMLAECYGGFQCQFA